MKKSYIQPSMDIEQAESAEMICASRDITSNVGLGYGGVDVDGAKKVESRRHRTVWDDEEDLE